ncbi:gluconeogenesis factor YvcK family protein [Nocardioides alcanivorans]|uniref:gluconeogenesis factor YvcK family protein n=1 Tax=Nocardioides alcanivorans TaxID=2897352 RepID=UPI001F1E85BE|nr:uridine diphosphate-N-acetylglucosamine-binding protein YvcK [Nocardioides alcanivorans]
MSGTVPATPVRRSGRVVALGGGHGLHVTLSALRRVVDDLTGVVTVADNGGSSGRLRDEFGILPPGDLRMALAALCSDDDWGQTWAKVLQHRFSSDGELGGHAVGNILITALWELLGENVLGLEWVARLLAAEGRVLPMSDVPLDIEADVRGLDPDDPDGVSLVRGQADVAVTPGTIQAIRLVPEHMPANPEAVKAVTEAEWVFLGPGSWYTSVLPHLMLDGLREAIVGTQGRIVVVLNLPGSEGETSGYSSIDLLAVLFDRAPDLRIHTVLADRESVEHGQVGADLLAAVVASAGSELVLEELCMDDGSPRHDPIKLAAACARIIERV